MQLIELKTNQSIQDLYPFWAQRSKEIHELCVLFCSYKSVDYEEWMGTDEKNYCSLYEWILFILEKSSTKNDKTLLQEFITMLELFGIPHKSAVLITSKD